MENIQSLPVHIFLYMKEYLSFWDYLDFMNTNKSIFSEIKRETVTYEISSESGDGPSPKLLSNLGKLLTIVKDPKKQIGLNLHLNVPDNLFLIKVLSPHLNSLSLTTYDEFQRDYVDFSVFDNIPVVSLYKFQGITRITNGFNYIRELRLTVDCEELGDINRSQTLTKLELFHCKNLKRFPAQIEENEIQTLINHPNTSCDELVFEAFGSNVLEMNRLFTRYLQVLSIEINFILPHLTEASPLLSIPKLDLWNRVPDYFPILPSFYGKELNLTRFDVSSLRNPTKAPTIVLLTLRACVNLSELPIMPYLKELLIIRTEGLQCIPTFPQLASIRLHDVLSVYCINKQPRLLRLYLESCPKLVDFSNLDGQFLRETSIRECDSLVDVSPFRNSFLLKLRGCPNVSRIDFFDSENSSPYRDFRVADLELPLNCPRIRNLKMLSLWNLSKENIDLIEIRNINEVEISSCELYHSTQNLYEIKENLILKDCSNLTSLSNLQHIPWVLLVDLPKINDISGLGHHDCLYIYQVPYLMDLVHEYVDSDGRESPFKYIFDTIKRIYVLQNMLETHPYHMFWDVFLEQSDPQLIWSNE